MAFRKESVWTDVDEHAAEVTFDVDDGEDRDARLKRDRGFRARARDAQLPLELPVWEAGGDVPGRSPRVPWDVVGADGGPVAPPPREREASARRAPRRRPALDADAARAEAADTLEVLGYKTRLRTHRSPSDQRMRPPDRSPGPCSPARRCSARSRRLLDLPATRRPSLSADDSSARHRPSSSASTTPFIMRRPRFRSLDDVEAVVVWARRESARSVPRRPTQPCRWRDFSG